MFRSEEAGRAIEARYRAVLDQWPVPSTHWEIPTRQGPTFVIACGSEDAPPVLLLHGSQANSAAWIPDIASWATRFRLYAVDMIGEPGLSARIRPALDDDTHAQWLDAVMAGLGIGRAILVGTSLGGWLALDYAVRRPHAVRALALICPAGIGRQKNLLLKAAPLLLLGGWGKRKIREMVFGPAPATPPAALAPIAGLMDAIGNAVRPRIVKIPRLTDAELAGLSIPILAIAGERDALFDSRETCQRLQAHAPNAETCFIRAGYHFLPDQTDRVMDFLEHNAAAD